jgi:hypothetical protein
MLTQSCPTVQNAYPLHFARGLEGQLLTKWHLEMEQRIQHDLLVILPSVKNNTCPEKVYLQGYNAI